jgi:SRSO17 transposase
MVIDIALPENNDSIEHNFRSYLDYLTEACSHPAQIPTMQGYCLGLLLDGRKTSEPIAARLAPHRVESERKSIQNFMNNAPWNHEEILSRAVAYALPALTFQEPIRAWVIDDTGIPKKGKHSVGVSHQYCGQLGKQANCQVAVMLSLANAHASMPVSYRLYLPKGWIEDDALRRETKIPENIIFSTKTQIALMQIDDALQRQLPIGTVLADAAYGNDTNFRDELTERRLKYAVAIQSNTSVWFGDMKPLPPKLALPAGRPPKNLRRDAEHHPISVKDVALQIPASAYETVSWRKGTSGILTSRFARVRVRAAHGETDTQRQEEWLIIEWPLDQAEPIAYALSTLPDNISFQELIDTLHLRWRIERDFQEMKSELGLNEYEGRSWNGFHRHSILVISTYAFLLAQRGLFSP